MEEPGPGEAASAPGGAADTPTAAPAPAPPPPPEASPDSSAASYLPMGAYVTAAADGSLDGASVTSPPTQTWSRTYELPSARKVVSRGLQLVLDGSSEIRRASIYIGLLALGAFGPTVLLLLLAIDRLVSDPAIADMLLVDPSQVFLDQPQLAEPLLLIYGLLIAGIFLLVAISIDAQAIAIAILAGMASGTPLRLWEAVTRARQTFWRLCGAGLMVGVTSGVVALVVVAPFLRPFDTNWGLQFIGSMVGALVVTPFAFAASGIVLGDVGATETLRRSFGLFRIRKRIALVVTLFTLVTAAIQTFALDASMDAAVRVGELLHVDLTQGGINLILTAVIVLAFVVAFGSLTFTIAAIVAAPQVTAFLGLTYYSAGLDRARSADDLRPRRFRWVSVPMLVSMILIAVIAGVSLPSVAGLRTRPPNPIVSMLRAAAEGHGTLVYPFGSSNTVEDQTLDVIGVDRESVDVVSAGYAFLPELPDWLLDELFDCDEANVACGDRTGGRSPFVHGALLFHQRMSGPPVTAGPDEVGQWGAVIALAGYDAHPLYPDDSLSGASHAIVTRINQGKVSVHLFVAAEFGFDDVHTHTRSTWIGNDLLTLVPGDELETDPIGWDSFGEILYGRSAAHDSLRTTRSMPLLIGVEAPTITFTPTGAP